MSLHTAAKRRQYARLMSKRRSYRRKPRSNVRKRRYVRRSAPKMSRKRVLNIAAEKKRDKMMNYTNVTASQQTGGGTFLSTPSIITGGSSTPFVSVFCSTGRDNQTASTGRVGNKFDVSTRTSSLCYMVGLKEAIEIQVADGMPWQWRRICFTYKGGPTINGYLPTSSSSFYTSLNTTFGYTRVVNGLALAEQSTFFALLFQGVRSTDWTDPLTAKVDTERVSLKYDKTCTIASGNEQGTIRRYNRWHPMRHNLMYDDDESGGTTSASGYSVQSKVGMGDYWVIDIIKPRVGSTVSNQLLFNTESTLYWHEK
jgi:hypothetical protein